MSGTHSFFYRLLDVFFTKDKLIFKETVSIADNRIRLKSIGMKVRDTYENQ